MYIDPTIYNTKNLHPEDRIIIKMMDNTVRRAINLVKAEAAENGEYEGATLLEKISSEEQANCCNSVWFSYLAERRGVIASMIDSYPEDEEIRKQEYEGEPELDRYDYDEEAVKVIRFNGGEGNGD